MGYRGDYRDESVRYQAGQNLIADLYRVPYEAEIHAFRRHRPAYRLYKSEIRPADSKRIHALGLEPGHDVLVHQAGVNGSDHFERISVSNPASTRHDCTYSEFPADIACSPASAVNHDLQSLHRGECFQK